MNIRIILNAIICLLILTACEKQNIPVENDIYPLLKKSDEYYANLRQYKKSDHQIFYGWWGSTGVPGDPRFTGVYDVIPDSVDIVSLWGGIPPVGSHNHKLLQETRKLKGTRFVHVFFPDSFDSHNFSHDEAGVKKFAQLIIDSNNEHDLDGIDIDYESHALSIFSIDANFKILVEELGKHFGPKSGTGKLFIIDSYMETVPSFALEYIDYYAKQHYSPQGHTPNTIKSSLDRQVNGFPYSKCIITENYETVWSHGGYFMDYARWNPPIGKKGGVGAYHAEYEYAKNPDYKLIREAIQLMNPAVR